MPNGLEETLRTVEQLALRARRQSEAGGLCTVLHPYSDTARPEGGAAIAEGDAAQVGGDPAAILISSSSSLGKAALAMRCISTRCLEQQAAVVQVKGEFK